MPLVFSHEIDPTTVDLSDFRITTKKVKFFIRHIRWSSSS
ncbi:hypothetical protein LEP1GSC072_2189 [Leptospira noguchii str. Bonito]|nr:hypothetical protein LEP1GSC072_2189 [Leptospira noguchii str. Bonito]